MWTKSFAEIHPEKSILSHNSGSIYKKKMIKKRKFSTIYIYVHYNTVSFDFPGKCNIVQNRPWDLHISIFYKTNRYYGCYRICCIWCSVFFQIVGDLVDISSISLNQASFRLKDDLRFICLLLKHYWDT